MVGPWFLQPVLEAREAVLLSLGPVKLPAEDGLSEDNELRVLKGPPRAVRGT